MKKRKIVTAVDVLIAVANPKHPWHHLFTWPDEVAAKEMRRMERTCKNEDGKVCIDPISFKKAMLGVTAELKAFKKTQLRTALYVQGQSIPITYDKMAPRMDMVRTAGIGHTPDVRFRPSFLNWKARLIIEFSESMSVQSVVDLLNRAGRGGVGEWRPQKDGKYGTFRVSRHIDTPKEIGEVEAECSVPMKRITIPQWAMDQEIEPGDIDRILNEARKGTESVA